MSTTFSKLMASAILSEGSLAVDVPEDWGQGRTMFGGLQVAIALGAMRTLVTDVRMLPLRTLQATFVAPVPVGRTQARAQVLRTGKSATHVEARIVDGEGQPLAIVIGVFGAARLSVVAVTPVQPPLAPDSTTSIPLPMVAGITPAFTQQFDVRWRHGVPPYRGDTGRVHIVDVSLRDDGPTTEGHVVAIADFVPPVALAHLRVPGPGSTVTWMLELLVDRVDHLPLAGWRVDAELVAARDGYTSQAVMIWGPGGIPVAASHQSMLVFG